MSDIKKENIVLEKSFEFAVDVVNIVKDLTNRKEYVLSKQLLRSGTSIGANVNEAQVAQSRNDFISKMSIASKEARESRYWIQLLIKTNYLDTNSPIVKELLNKVEELIKILTSIIKTSQGR